MPWCLGRNKVNGYWDLVVLGFWVWSNLCGGTVSLKFRQLNSAVCVPRFVYTYGYANWLSFLGCGILI